MASTTQVILGGLAKLPCDVTTTQLGDKVSLVIWYREGRPSPIYSFDARETKLSKGKHWSEEQVLGTRASFKVGIKPTAILTLEQAKSTDGGAYRCRVDFQKSPTRNHMVNLTVIMPVEKVAILDEQGSHITNYILGPFNEGATVTIACVATGGNPPPRVTWWQDNTLLDESFGVIPERRVQNLLKLESLGRQHLHAVLMCLAGNSDLSPPISSAVTLNMNLRPLWVKLRGENKPLSADNTYQLECEIVGSRPPPTITWWKGSTAMKNSKDTTSAEGNMTVSILPFTPTIADSGKYLSCRAVQSLIPDSGLEDGWKLDIQHVPLVTLELGSSVNSTMIREFVDVYFECNIKSNPWIYQIRWMHNGKQLYNNVAEGTLVSNQSLVLQSVTRSRSGLYTCVASNREGDGESNPVHLDIKFTPICRPGQVRSLGAARMEPAKIACELEANPPMVNFTWKFNTSDSELTDIPTNHVVADQARSVAMYTPKTESDFGTILCWGENEIGIQKEPCVFILTPAGKPDTLSNCTVLNQTTDSLQIECMEGFDGGLPQEFSVEVYTLQRKQLISTITSSTPHFFITGLESGNTYEVVLVAVNKKGRSDPNVMATHTLKSAEKHIAYLPGILQMTPLVGAGAGGAAALLLGGALLVVRLRRRARGPRRKEARGPRQPRAPPTPRDHHNETADDKNPDIIPHGGDDEYSEEERAFEYLNRAPTRMYTVSTATHPREPPAQLLPMARFSYTCDRTKDEIAYTDIVHSGAPLPLACVPRAPPAPRQVILNDNQI
ncbi:neural cell adhesion molecule 2-like [Arctopsyche grandis]|uniref:neural cell adhesion molecule 2-like n=1 Tax=Arctopsyche grandis TaxID=121162 RepID=UPI00406D77F6